MRHSFSLLIIITIILSSCEKTYRDEIYTKPQIVADPVIKDLSPEESLKTMYLPKGYKIQLVASEPLINEPVTIVWDGNGKMYVAQMMTYMQDIDAGNEQKPWSRVSVLEDTDKDGVMDKSTTFVDSLVLPRIILPLDDRVIIGETYQRNLYSYRDTNGDNVADEKILLLEDTVRDNRNLEHQDANMLWSIDNWLYVTNKTFRYRYTQNKFVVDTLPEPAPGQWGLTQDETGRLFFSRAGAEVPANGFQQHVSYGVLELPNPWDESFMEPWPIVGTPDAQGGENRQRPEDNTLNRFTGVAGQEIYLGDKMPPAYGDLFIPEPVGRLVRRAKVNHNDGKIFLENRYDKTEFLASTDPLFRPVHATTGPDGCLYVVDMYRGIIQEGQWVGEGSYLRGVVQEKGHDKFHSRGRIYKIVHEEEDPGPMPQMLGKSSAELIEYLGHPNGWWRNTAQKLIVLKNDVTVQGTLERIVESEKAPDLQRLHALWTLDGLNAISKDFLKRILIDEDYRVRAAAVRISDKFVKQNDLDMIHSLERVAADSNVEVLQQYILTARIQNDATKETVRSIAARYPNNEVIKATAGENLNPSFNVIQGLREKYKLRGGDAAAQIVHGYQIFQELCSTCHGKDAKGIPQLAPPLIGSPRVKADAEVMAKILLHGLEGPVDGKKYNGPMAPIAQESNEYIADIISYVREELNGAGTVWRGRIRGVREATKDKTGYYTLKEIEQESKKK
jgi:mono/diheme cytochrome c family protein/glucose/arabinose dehydrogenase